MALVESAGNIVTREQLIENIWQDNFLVGDKALTQAIWSLRKLFELQPRCIETIPKQGYVLHLSVEQQIPKKPQSVKNSANGLWAMGIATLLTMLGFSLVFWANYSSDHSTTVAVNWQVNDEDAKQYWTALESAAAQRQLTLMKQTSLAEENKHNLRLLVQIGRDNAQQTLRLTLSSQQPAKMQSRSLSQTQLSPQIVADEALALFFAMSIE